MGVHGTPLNLGGRCSGAPVTQQAPRGPKLRSLRANSSLALLPSFDYLRFASFFWCRSRSGPVPPPTRFGWKDPASGPLQRPRAVRCRRLRDRRRNSDRASPPRQCPKVGSTVSKNPQTLLTRFRFWLSFHILLHSGVLPPNHFYSIVRLLYSPPS